MSVRNSELTEASGAPSWDNFTKPSIAEVLGTKYDASRMTGGIASLGQEKPETMNRGRPAAARMSCTRIGLRKTPATTRPRPATDSTNGTWIQTVPVLPRDLDGNPEESRRHPRSCRGPLGGCHPLSAPPQQQIDGAVLSPAMTRPRRDGQQRWLTSLVRRKPCDQLVLKMLAAHFPVVDERLGNVRFRA